MERQYFYLVVRNYDEYTVPCKIFLQEHDAIVWGRRKATKTLKETKDSNYEYVLYKQEITRTGELQVVKKLYPYYTKALVDAGLDKNHPAPEKTLEEFDWGNVPTGSDYDIDKEKSEHISEEEQRLIDMDDRIDSFLRGQMTKEEESQFLSDCKSNPELMDRAYMTALLTKSLKK